MERKKNHLVSKSHLVSKIKTIWFQKIKPMERKKNHLVSKSHLVSKNKNHLVSENITHGFPKKKKQANSVEKKTSVVDLVVVVGVRTLQEPKISENLR